MRPRYCRVELLYNLCRVKSRYLHQASTPSWQPSSMPYSTISTKRRHRPRKLRQRRTRLTKVEPVEAFPFLPEPTTSDEPSSKQSSEHSLVPRWSVSSTPSEEPSSKLPATPLVGPFVAELGTKQRAMSEAVQVDVQQLIM